MVVSPHISCPEQSAKRMPSQKYELCGLQETRAPSKGNENTLQSVGIRLGEIPQVTKLGINSGNKNSPLWARVLNTGNLTGLNIFVLPGRWPVRFPGSRFLA